MSREMTAGPVRPSVAHLIGELGYGGTERQLYLLLQHLRDGLFGHHVVVFNRSAQGDYRQALENRGVSVWEVPAEARSVWGRVWHVRRRLLQWQPAIVHSWTVHDNPYAAVAGRLAGVPVRWGSLRGSPDLPGFRRLPWLLRQASLRGPERLVVNSVSLRDRLVADGLSAERVEVLENCVELPGRVEPIDLTDLGIAHGDHLLGTVGNLRTVKNPLLFVRTMARVLPKQPGWRALMVGQQLPDEPELPRQIDAEISRHGLESRILRVGFSSEVPALLARMDVFCLTSDSEGMPNTVLEAMAAAKPVVATRVGGVPELVVDGETGLLAERDDEEGLAAAVDRLLTNPELARRMGKAGRERVEARHRCEDAARRLEILYREALDSQAGRRGSSQ